MAAPKVTSPLGRVQENFSWRDCLGTFLLLLIMCGSGIYLADTPLLPQWAYPLVVLALAGLSAIVTLGRRFFELILRMLVGRGGLDL